MELDGKRLKYDNPMELTAHTPELASKAVGEITENLAEFDVKVEEYPPGYHFVGRRDHKYSVSFFERGRYDLCTTFKNAGELISYYQVFMDGYETALANVEKGLHG